jgi:putative effector of murein hydrolase
MTALLTVAWLSAFMGLPRDLVLSLLPRSITIPFAVEVVKLHGGNPALASAFVVATGTLGSVLGGSLLTWFRVRSALARGLAMGVGAHGQGTAMAFLEGQTEGTLAGLAMTLGGVTTTLLVPWVIRFVLKG